MRIWPIIHCARQATAFPRFCEVYLSPREPSRSAAIRSGISRISFAMVVVVGVVGCARLARRADDLLIRVTFCFCRPNSEVQTFLNIAISYMHGELPSRSDQNTIAVVRAESSGSNSTWIESTTPSSHKGLLRTFHFLFQFQTMLRRLPSIRTPSLFQYKMSLKEGAVSNTR
jgi:hypothetical protein